MADGHDQSCILGPWINLGDSPGAAKKDIKDVNIKATIKQKYSKHKVHIK